MCGYSLHRNRKLTQVPILDVGNGAVDKVKSCPKKWAFELSLEHNTLEALIHLKCNFKVALPK